jgi:uncharacterized protein DUF3828
MRAKRFCTIVFFVAAIPFSNLSRAQDAASAKILMENVYRHYQNGGDGIEFRDTRASLYFHSSLLALEKADIKANSPDIQAIDWDPICGCQDWAGIWDLKIDITLETPQRAIARATFWVNPPSDQVEGSQKKIEFTLIPERGEWRIYDILDKSDPKSTFSVRKLLENDLASLRSHPAPVSH